MFNKDIHFYDTLIEMDIYVHVHVHVLAFISIRSDRSCRADSSGQVLLFAALILTERAYLQDRSCGNNGNTVTMRSSFRRILHGVSGVASLAKVWQAPQKTSKECLCSYILKFVCIGLTKCTSNIDFDRCIMHANQLYVQAQACT